MDSLPQEIAQLILGLLDKKSARIARVVCTEWFKWIKLTKFDIYFATSDLLPQIIDRLSQYQYPLDLNLLKCVRISEVELIENLARLTQLRSLKIIDSGSVVYNTNPSDFFKLSTLTNLEELTLTNEFPLQLLKFFPRLKRCSPIARNNQINALEYCKNMESVSVLDNGYLDFDELPESLTSLDLAIIMDESGVANLSPKLSKLTRLKELSFRLEDEHQVDLGQITWLESLVATTKDVTGIENSRQLTHLKLSSTKMEGFGQLFRSLAGLSRLKQLDLDIANAENVSLSDMSQLTSLSLYCYTADIATLSTSLRDLTLRLTGPNEISSLTNLTNLTRLVVKDSYILDYEPINCLTNLLELDFNFPTYEARGSISNLQNLSRLWIADVPLTAHEITRLKNLEFLESMRMPMDQDIWQGLGSLTRLTGLRLYYTITDENSSKNFDLEVIAKLPLQELLLQLDVKNYWTFLPTITTLEKLYAGLIEDDENIRSLTSLNNLTNLTMRSKKESVTAVHLTCLTNLQVLSVFPQNYSREYLSLVLPRLINCAIARRTEKQY